jgi:hypothetical protein
MGEASSSTRSPHGAAAPASSELDAFQHGVELGRQYADVAVRRLAAWAEENPGQLLLAGLAAGFLAGKLLFRPQRVRLE